MLILIKHSTFNNQVSNRLTQKGSIIIMIQNWSLAIHMYAFFMFSSKLFFGFFTNSKTANRVHFQNRLQFNIYHKIFQKMDQRHT